MPYTKRKLHLLNPDTERPYCGVANAAAIASSLDEFKSHQDRCSNCAAARKRRERAKLRYCLKTPVTYTVTKL